MLRSLVARTVIVYSTSIGHGSGILTSGRLDHRTGVPAMSGNLFVAANGAGPCVIAAGFLVGTERMLTANGNGSTNRDNTRTNTSSNRG